MEFNVPVVEPSRGLVSFHLLSGTAGTGVRNDHYYEFFLLPQVPKWLGMTLSLIQSSIKILIFCSPLIFFGINFDLLTFASFALIILIAFIFLFFIYFLVLKVSASPALPYSCSCSLKPSAAVM